jgi:hypothetical protein
MAHGFLLFLAFLAVLCFPSSNLQWFDGLPLSRIWEYAALAAALPFLLFSDLRIRQAECWKKLRIRPAVPWIVLGAALIVKVGLFASGVSAGFSGCYRSPAEPTEISHEELPAAACERSYENLFGRYAGTRPDGTIRFGPDTWNLVFLNTGRYNYYGWEAGNILRTRIPISVRWSGVPDVAAGAPVTIEYVGEGSVVWGDVRAALPPAYDAPNAVTVGPPSVESPLEIEYAFDDGSRSGQDEQAWGPRASIAVVWTASGASVPVYAKPPAAGFRIPALMADALILLWLASCLPALLLSVRRDLVFLAAFAAAAGILAFLPLAPLVRSIAITLLLAAALVVHVALRPLRPASLYALAAGAALALVRVWASAGFGMVLLRSAGNDALSYEAQAYTILVSGSLQGGEPVFVYIPGYRYVKFLEHALFGDGDMLYGAAQLAAFFGGVFVLFRGAENRKLPTPAKILLAGLGAGMIVLGGYYVSGVIREGLSEYPTWTLLLWAIAGLAAAPGPGALLAGAAALAAAYTIRPNQAPGILWILILAAAGSWKKHARWVLAAGGLALGIALLPLAHNLYFGGRWEAAAGSGGLSVNLVLTPDVWLAFLKGDAAAAEAVREQMGMLFLVTEVSRSMLPTLALLAGFLAGWLAFTVWHIARRRRAGPAAWLAVPVFFLAVHLVYGLSTYYPRHVVAGYLSMAAVSVVVLLRRLPAGPAVESPHG